MRAALLTNQLFSWNNHNELAIGGGEKFSWQFSQLLQDLGYEVHIYQYSPVKFDKIHSGAHIHGIPNTVRDGWFWTGMCDYFYDCTKHFDRVFINLPDFAAGKVRGDATLITHGISWCGKAIGELLDDEKEKLSRIFSKVGKNVVVHEFTREAIRGFGLDKVADKVVCVENYVDTEAFKPGDKKPIIVFPGRAEVAKGTELMPGILDGLSGTEWKTAWVGDGSQFCKLKRLEAKYGNFHAMSVPIDSMPDVYSRSSICVVFNLFSRGNSLTLMEGMSSGCACVGITGGTTLIKNDVNGLLCEPDAKDIVDKIKRLMADSELRSRLGCQSRKDIIRDHNKEKWEREWTSVINGGANWT